MSSFFDFCVDDLSKLLLWITKRKTFTIVSSELVVQDLRKVKGVLRKDINSLNLSPPNLGPKNQEEGEGPRKGKW